MKEGWKERWKDARERDESKVAMYVELDPEPDKRVTPDGIDQEII